MKIKKVNECPACGGRLEFFGGFGLDDSRNIVLAYLVCAKCAKSWKKELRPAVFRERPSLDEVI